MAASELLPADPQSDVTLSRPNSFSSTGCAAAEGVQDPAQGCYQRCVSTATVRTRRDKGLARH